MGVRGVLSQKGRMKERKNAFLLFRVLFSLFMSRVETRGFNRGFNFFLAKGRRREKYIYIYYIHPELRI